MSEQTANTVPVSAPDIEAIRVRLRYGYIETTRDDDGFIPARDDVRALLELVEDQRQLLRRILDAEGVIARAEAERDARGFLSVSGKEGR